MTEWQTRDIAGTGQISRYCWRCRCLSGGIYTITGYFWLDLKKVMNGFQVSAHIYFLRWASSFSTMMYSEVNPIQWVMWHEFLDLWKTTFLATAIEISEGFLNLHGRWMVDSVWVTLVQWEWIGRHGQMVCCLCSQKCNKNRHQCRPVRFLPFYFKLCEFFEKLNLV